MSSLSSHTFLSFIFDDSSYVCMKESVMEEEKAGGKQETAFFSDSSERVLTDLRCAARER